MIARRWMLGVATAAMLAVACGCSWLDPHSDSGGQRAQRTTYMNEYSSMAELQRLQARKDAGNALMPRSPLEQGLIDNSQERREAMQRQFEQARQDFQRQLAQQRAKAERDRQHLNLPK